MNEMQIRLRNAGVGNYVFEAKIIEKHAEKYNLDFMALEKIIKRRVSREPLQYILGEWEFFGDVYKLNKNCLIPRPETEFLTEYIIENAKPNAKILDLGSGSGCISISALKRRSDLTAVLIDISSGAIEISKENAEINEVEGRIEFHCLDMIKDHEEIIDILKKPSLVKRVPPAGGGCFEDIIVSNPPYLTKAEIAKIKTEKTELYHEPVTALLGGGDGLVFFRFIINNYADKTNAVTIFECGINQSKDIIKMFEKIGFSCDVIQDYSKIERVVIGRK